MGYSPREGRRTLDELFRLAAKASDEGIDPELELRSAARRYADRLRSWERPGSQRVSDPDEG